jgi:hypothetical protein
MSRNKNAGNLPTSEKTDGPRKRKTKAGPPRGGPEGVNQYIAGQLRAIYDDVVAQPIPDRLLQLLNRLDSDAKK